MLQVALITLLALFTALAVRLLRNMGPLAHWVAAYCAAAVAGLMPAALPTFPLLQLVAQAFGTFCAALLLSGTLRLAQRAVPRWLLPAALGFGLLRSIAAYQFGVPTGYAMGLLFEPFAVFGAAFIAFRFAQQPESSLAERLLAPAMVSLAVAGLLNLLWLASNGPMLALVPMWLVVAPIALGIQIQATANWLQRALRRGFEEQVAARTSELAKSEERYRTVSELSSDFAFKLRVDRDARLTREWIAGAFEATLGWRPEDIDGHGWFRLLESGASGRDEMIAKYRSARADGQPVALERCLVGLDGRPRWLQFRFAKLREVADGSIEVLGAARDVTELKRGEQERERLAQHIERVERLESLGILAGGIAHDFNNLLTVIRGSAQLALDELPADAPARQRIARITEAAQHAASLTDQMLTYAGKSSPARTPLDLGALVASMAELLRASVPERCELVFESGSELPLIEADASGVRQVLLNLVMNASEAQRDLRMRIVVRTALVEISREQLRGAFGNKEMAPGGVVELSVSDDGCGMEPAVSARVFEPFFTTKFSGGGRGLGMAAVLGIMQSHHGAICFESERGRGTRVRALFPPTARRVEVSASPPAQGVHATDGTVLIVDDDDGILEVAGEVIARAGYRVLKAHSGCEALDRVREAGTTNVDAVVLDLAMPDMSGEETFLRLRELRADLPVILVSGYDSARVADRFAARGLDAFLRKPWEPEELVAALQRVLRR